MEPIARPSVGVPSLRNRVWDIEARTAVLDGIRGLAIILVLLFHGAVAFRPESGLQQIFADLVGLGWIGVDLFFVLSGFLITRILLRTRKNKTYYRKFYFRRALRIFPVFYLTLFFFLYVLPLLTNTNAIDGHEWFVNHQLWYWTYYFNWPLAIAGAFPPLFYIHHFWSLAIEEQFYLVWPAVAKVAKLKYLFMTTIMVIIICFSARILIPMSWQTAYTATPFRIDSLLMGALLALVLTSPKMTRTFKKWAKPATAIAFLVFTGITLLETDSLRNDSTHKLGYTALSILFFNLIFYVLRHPRGKVSEFLEQRVLVFFGKYSYAIYIFHWPIIVYLYRDLGLYAYLIDRWGNMFGMIASMLAVILASLALAMVSWQFFERPILQLKTRVK